MADCVADRAVVVVVVVSNVYLLVCVSAQASMSVSVYAPSLSMWQVGIVNAHTSNQILCDSNAIVAPRRESCATGIRIRHLGTDLVRQCCDFGTSEQILDDSIAIVALRITSCATVLRFRHLGAHPVRQLYDVGTSERILCDSITISGP